MTSSWGDRERFNGRDQRRLASLTPAPYQKQLFCNKQGAQMKIWKRSTILQIAVKKPRFSYSTTRDASSDPDPWCVHVPMFLELIYWKDCMNPTYRLVSTGRVYSKRKNGVVDGRGCSEEGSGRTAMAPRTRQIRKCHQFTLTDSSSLSSAWSSRASRLRKTPSSSWPQAQLALWHH